MTSPSPIVVSIDEYRPRPAPNAITRVEAYWNELRAGRLMPDRADVDPRGLSDVLEHAFVLERVARGLARFRVAGTHVNALMGAEVRGMPVTTMILPESRDLVGEALEAVFDEPAIARLSLASPAGLARPGVAAQLLILPLRGESGQVNRALGCLVADSDGGRASRRFRVTDQMRRTLTGYAAGSDGSGPTGKPVPERSHLTLVKSDA